jgi:hypothetical protein
LNSTEPGFFSGKEYSGGAWKSDSAFLNPVSTSIATMTGWTELEEKTRENRSSRGDTDESVLKGTERGMLGSS